MQSRCRVYLRHGRDVGSGIIPRTEPVHWWHHLHVQGRQTAAAAGEQLFIGAVGGRWRVRGQREGPSSCMAADQTCLQQTFDATEVLEDEFVTGIELDAGLPVDALGIEFGAEAALWPRAVTPGFPGPANLALKHGSGQHEMRASGVEKREFKAHTAIVALRRG